MRVRIAVLLLLVVVAGVAAWSYLRPIPAVAATGSLPASEVIAGTPPVLPWPARGSAGRNRSKPWGQRKLGKRESHTGRQRHQGDDRPGHPRGQTFEEGRAG